MRSTFVALVLSSMFTLGCGKSGESSSAGSANIPPEAQAIFAQRCTPCHGATGAGDGMASASLTPRPRNFHDKVWQESVTDDHIEKIIIAGGAAVGKAPAMPGNPDLQAKAEVVKGLRAKIRSFGQ
jgi:mono/diheme cytochrome c family protein